MTVDTYNFTTGPSPLPDVGVLSYNGCTFSSLFSSEISANYVKDEAQRTVKWVEYTIKVSGIATVPDNDPDLAPTMLNLQRLLCQQGGALIYEGRGLDLFVNLAAANDIGAGGTLRDVAWGPVPEVLSFQTLGGGGAALVDWQCKVRVYESVARRVAGIGGIPLLQFNYESSVSYNEDGFSIISNSGTLEIALSRPNQKTRTLTQTADDARNIIETRLMAGVDLSKFRMTRREFNLSRDKRTLTWSFQAEELPYMKLPADCTVARGSYSVRPAQQGMGLCNWFCTLRCTYVVRADRPRRTAWIAFLLMLRLRMKYASYAPPVDLKAPQNPPRPAPQQNRRTALGTFNRVFEDLANKFGINTNIGMNAGEAELKDAIAHRKDKQENRAMLLDFGMEEGLYLDSKTVTFHATWRLVTPFDNILMASGLWRKLPEDVGDTIIGPFQPGQRPTGNLWAISMREVQGARSWLANQHDPKADLIVDFGGG